MANYGFGYVTEDGFLSFRKELEKGALGAIDITPYTNPDAPLSSFGAPLPVRLKLKLVRGIEEVEKARLPPAKLTVEQIDRLKWDPPQRNLDDETRVYLSRKDPTKKAAALTIREHFLQGGGRAQTRLPPAQEVILGRKQVLMARGQFKDLIALLNLEEVIDDIDLATEELAEALGEGAFGLAPSQAKVLRQRRALSACARSFNDVLTDIDWQLAQPDTTDEEKQLLNEIRTPLLLLLAAFPPPAKSKKEDQSE